MTTLSRLTLLTVCLVVAGCSPLKPAEPVRLYRLPEVAAESSPGQPAVAITLRINRPGTSDALAGRQILAAPDAHRLSAWPGARWVSPAPQLWRDWLVAHFLADGRVAHVTGDGQAIRAGVELGGTLRAFHSEETEAGRQRVTLVFDARLVAPGSQRILASRTFSAREMAATDDLEAVVAAFGRAAEQVGTALADWVVAQQRAEDDSD